MRTKRTAFLRHSGAQPRHEIYFQDAGSQLVADIVGLKSGERFLDVCAAPGSKTTYIATFSDDPIIVAGDASAPRIKLLARNCHEQGTDFVNICQYNALQPLPFAEESFDIVLVDAPCTGTGTIRHNPEIRYFLKRGDFEELSLKQLAILTNASKLVKTRGKLIYSTCSLEIEENEFVADRFVGENLGFSAIRTSVGDRFATSEGFTRTFPHRDSTDGFFIARFQRAG